ncbi:MAG: MG2 domain-containing protein [Chitinophagales bacterium]
MKRLLPLLLLAVLASCNQNRVKLSSTNAREEVPVLGNLIFTFDRDLVPDSLLNRWDSTAYLEFTPAITGRFQWQSPYELIFSPDRELLPSTAYKAVMTSKLTARSRYHLGYSDALSFHTPWQQMIQAQGMWALPSENATQPVIQTEVVFNYPVSADAVQKHVHLFIDGKEHAYQLTQKSDAKLFRLQINDVRPDESDHGLVVQATAGLPAIGGTTGSIEETKLTSALASPYRLTITGAEANHDGTEGTIHFYTSQQPLAQDLAAAIHITPAATFKTQITEDGFLIVSDKFNAENSYNVTINPGLKGRLGGTLRDEFTQTFMFGELEPAIKFTNNKGVYLTPAGSKNIEVSLINVPKVTVSVYKIYENNLMAALRFGQSDYNYEDYYYSDNALRSEFSLGDVVYEKSIETQSLPRRGSSRLLKFDFPDALKDYKGLYRVTIRSDQQYYLSESRFVSLSDIGLISKQNADKIWVFANSIHSAQSLPGVTITVMGANNQKIGSGTTDKNGVAEITISKRDQNGFKPTMIMAKTATDFNFLPFSSTQVETSRFDVGGKNINASTLDAFIYSERDMYRPGEKINLSCIVRNSLWQSPGQVPVKMTILLPNGQELKTIRKTLNEEGSMEAAIELSPAAITGSYTVEVYTANDVLLNSTNLLVEEFMPDRIKVTASLNQPALQPGQTAQLDILAENYFGPPAANRNYEVEIQVHTKNFSPKQYPGFDFSLNTGDNFNTINREGKTDDQGRAKESWTVPAEYANNGILEAGFYTTVFDESGRPVNRKCGAAIYTQPVFVGLGSTEYYCPVNQVMQIPIIALNKDEQPVATKAHLLILKREYKTVLSKSGSYYRYESQQEVKTIVNEDIVLPAGTRQYPFIPKTSGDYEIQLSVPGVNRFVSHTFFSYGWGLESSSFDVNNEGQVDISLDKAKYKTGESAKILFKTPFNGKLLVTIETDKVLEHFYLQTEKRTASASIDIKPGFLPNAYITATLIKPHEETELPLTVAHGFAPILVEETSRHMSVQVLAPKSVRSHTHQKITVRAAPNAMITLAAVDEGILAMTGYRTPDPYDFFYQKRALNVNAYDLYPLLFPEVSSIRLKTGGDGFNLSKRVNPVQNKRVKLLTYWSGIRATNSNGEATFEFDLPQFSGEVRLMAVAYKANAFGSGEAHMKVADPIVLATALPRFVAPRDTIEVPVTITNTTASAANVSANIKTEGPLQIIGPASKQSSVSGNAETRVSFRLTANGAMAPAKVVVEVNGGGQKYTEETDITVRPAASLQKASGSGSVAANTVTTIDCGNSAYIPSSQSYKLLVSRSLLTQQVKDLRYLIQYPYGCTEQTISAAFPQLYYGDLSAAVDPIVAKNANYHIQEAIKKIKMRQLYNGGVSLWDQGEEQWWASVYAAHFLVETRKAGYEVDEDLTDKLFQYLEAKLRNKEMITWYYNRNQNRKIAPREVAYSLYVLALAGRQQISTMNYYRENPQLLTLDSRYLLAAAYALSGNKSQYAALLPQSFAGEVSDKETGGSFASPMRDEAIALNVLAETNPQHPQVTVMASHIAQELKQQPYLSTQERCFGLLALGKLARDYANSNSTAQLYINGKVVAEMTGTPILLNSKNLAGSRLEIRTKGNQPVFYSFENEGITADGSFKVEDNFLKVRKQFYDRYGHPVNATNFTQNDLIVVGITLQSAYSRTIENIVVTDMLPAGFEIENPRVKEIPGMDWIKDATPTSATDFRDDRVNIFTNIYSGTVQHFYYAVRAVSPGTFTVGPVSADAMYAGEYHSYSGGGKITVKAK